MGSKNLEDLQRRFWHLITSPKGAREAFTDLVKTDPGAVPLTSWISGRDEAAAAERAQRYANMYFYRLLDILAQDYGFLQKLIGEARFEQLVREYLEAYPSAYPSVRHVGRYLAEFLETSPLAAEIPWIADFATLEWSRAEVFDRAAAPVLTQEDLAAVQPADWETLAFKTIPAMELIRLSWPVHRVWRALLDGETPPAIEREESAILVWRQEFDIWHRPLESDETAAFEKMRAGKTFAEICEALATGGEEIEQAAQKAAASLAKWVADRVLAR